MRILVVEDNDVVADVVARTLTGAHFVVERVASAEAAYGLMAAEQFDLAVIDIGLPGADGVALLRRLRRAGKVTPALMLTARDSTDQKVRALDLGADDFLSKPFESAELVARCRALIRRASFVRVGAVTLGRMQVDLSGRQLNIDHSEIQLTSREWLVLECLVRQFGRVVSKERLLQAMSNLEQSVSPNAVEAYVSRLRSKLGDAVVIRSLRGLGYRLEEAKHS